MSGHRDVDQGSHDLFVGEQANSLQCHLRCWTYRRGRSLWSTQVNICSSAVKLSFCSYVKPEKTLILFIYFPEMFWQCRARCSMGCFTVLWQNPKIKISRWSFMIRIQKLSIWCWGKLQLPLRHTSVCDVIVTWLRRILVVTYVSAKNSIEDTVF